MKISIVGSGYVGLVSATCFADMGLEVVCIDKDLEKIALLQQGKVPIYEPGLSDIVARNMEHERLSFTADFREGIKDAEAVFIAVGTPMSENGEADLSAVFEVAREIGQYMENDLVVVDKSTVPVGTADKVHAIIAGELEKRNLNTKLWFEVVSNPEFLKEGVAINDFMHPDRVVIGVSSRRAQTVMHRIYRSFMVKIDRLIMMDVRSAEMTKYAANCMLATKISFINEIANICEAVGADISMVRLGLCSDSRIGTSFLYPGCGYGGSCFPKDVRALIALAQERGIAPAVITAVDETNIRQKKLLSEKIKKAIPDLNGKTIAIWGLSFKPNTDDMRESPALDTIQFLVEAGAHVRVYDPAAMTNAKAHYLVNFPDIEYCKNLYSTVENADAVVLHTEWREFRTPNFNRIKMLMKTPLIFDGRNILNHEELTEQGFCHIRIGVGTH